MGRCNSYGAENPGGYQDKPFGGFLNQPVAVQTECHAMGTHRFHWECEHGHRGPQVELCEWHWAEFSGRSRAMFEGGEGSLAEFNGRRMTVPWNLRRDVQACPACAAEAPDCTDPEHARMFRGQPGRCGCRQHKCRVRLVPA